MIFRFKKLDFLFHILVKIPFQHPFPDCWLKLDVSVYHVNTQVGSPSNKSYTFIIILADNQFVHVILWGGG